MRLSDYSNEQLVRTKATLFARVITEMCLTGSGEIRALQAVHASDPRSPLAPIFEKAIDSWGTKAVLGSSTNWGAPLSYATELASAFVTLMEAESVVGKIPGLRKVPPMVPIPVSGASGVAGWVGELKPTPMTQLTLGSLTVPIAKAQAMVGLSKELLRAPGAAPLVRDDLIATLAAYIDRQFTDPAVAAVTGIHPASITNGTVGLVATGVPTTDVPVLIGAFFAARPSAARPVLLVSPSTQSALALGKVDPGMPVVVSASLGGMSVVLDAAAVATAGTDDIGVMVSENASLQVSETPDAPPTAATTYISMFQANSVATKAEWFISWARADVTAVKYSAPA